jgi:hypothetical protein
MSAPLTCAAPECNNSFVRRPDARGRPQIYCSPQCRPSYSRPQLSVDLEREDDDGDEPRSGRDWMVSLRRGDARVVIRDGLGSFSATALATELRALIVGSGRTARQEGGTIE